MNLNTNPERIQEPLQPFIPTPPSILPPSSPTCSAPISLPSLVTLNAEGKTRIKYLTMKNSLWSRYNSLIRKGKLGFFQSHTKNMLAKLIRKDYFSIFRRIAFLLKG